MVETPSEPFSAAYKPSGLAAGLVYVDRVPVTFCHVPIIYQCAALAGARPLAAATISLKLLSKSNGRFSRASSRSATRA